MNTLGLRKVGNFEDVLARVTKDEQYIDGTIAPGIQDYAKQIINSPDFQRVKDRLEEDLATQTRTHIEHVTYQNHIHQHITASTILLSLCWSFMSSIKIWSKYGRSS